MGTELPGAQESAGIKCLNLNENGRGPGWRGSRRWDRKPGGKPAACAWDREGEEGGEPPDVGLPALRSPCRTPAVCQVGRLRGDSGPGQGARPWAVLGAPGPPWRGTHPCHCGVHAAAPCLCPVQPTLSPRCLQLRQGSASVPAVGPGRLGPTRAGLSWPCTSASGHGPAPGFAAGSPIVGAWRPFRLFRWKCPGAGKWRPCSQPQGRGQPPSPGCHSQAPAGRRSAAPLLGQGGEEESRAQPHREFPGAPELGAEEGEGCASGYQGPAGVTGPGQVCVAWCLLAPMPGAAGKWPVNIWITATEVLAAGGQEAWGGQGQALQAVPVLQHSALGPQYSGTGAVRAGGRGRLWEQPGAACWPCSNHRVWQSHRLWVQFSCCLSPGLA